MTKTYKNKWSKIGGLVGKGVHTMGFHTDHNYKSMLVHFQEHSDLAPHFHSKEWEVIMILDGKCEDISTNTKLSKGDVYIIPRNAIHSLVTQDTECYMYIMFSSKKNNLKISESDKILAKAMMDAGKHSFKAK